MRVTASRINKEEQVKVVVRLKPETNQAKYGKCVYLSEQENHLVVETGEKKQIFVFDHVAHQTASQSDIYKTIGKQAVESSFQGYNCSIFAYGQTGAGKTYSIMGDLCQMQNDIYCQSRGILPRLIQDVFEELKSNSNQKYTITCSYMEIYNQQIFDLLSNEKRIHQIRQNKRGIYVEGLNQCKINSYKQGVQHILQGQNSRSMALTYMNTESSRSHVIFTLFIQSEIIEESRVTIRKSKINIIDLAGSQRIKHTHVEGQRLKQGCNINKSLHVLGNVINALVESTKKKKHIPYRDSKLTYYLKDSLGGNSITKLLANVHCGKQYFGDTLSTLMFAKRIKSLKMKVEINENQSDNFDMLRKEVRRLRQQLAEAKYFKVDFQKSERSSLQNDLSHIYQKITDNTQYDAPIKAQAIQIFQQNELHYKALIEIYEQHIKNCSGKLPQRKNSINMISQWKKSQKRNNALTGLLKRFPAFSKIYRQNLLLKQDKGKNNGQYQPDKINEQASNKIIKEPIFIANEDTTNYDVESVIQTYEAIIDQMKQKFQECLLSFQKNYLQLQNECKSKDKKIKQLSKRIDIPADIEQLTNENQYLHLNILNLENQIEKYRETENRKKIQKRQSKRNSVRSNIQNSMQKDEGDDQLLSVIEKLKYIKEEAMREADAAENQKKEMETMINGLRSQINSLMQENRKLLTKYHRSRSRRRSDQKQKTNISQTKKSFIQTFRSTEEFSVKDNFLTENFSKEIMMMKLDIKKKQKQIIDLRSQVNRFIESDQKIEEEFGKDLSKIITEYRQYMLKEKSKNSITKSHKAINKWKEQDPFLTSFKLMDNQQRKSQNINAIADSKVFKLKDSKSIKKDELQLHKSGTNFYNKKSIFSPK